MKFAPCPECGADVDSMTGDVVPGPEIPIGQMITFRDPDRVKGFTLNPCGHAVGYVEWRPETGWTFPTGENGPGFSVTSG